MSYRLDNVRELTAHADADAVLITYMPDIRWATGFTGSNALLLVATSATHFLTDGRYRSQANEQVQHAAIHVPGYDLLGHVTGSGLIPDAARVAFQSDRLTVADRERLGASRPDVTWMPAVGFLETVRASKEDSEIAAIRRAQAVTEAVFDEVLPQIGPGVCERDLAAEIVYQHLRRGVDAMAFDPIVASGLRGALPHARASSKRLATGEFVVIDMGGVLDGYASDMTRTIAIGEPDAGMRRAYEAVLEAQARAIDAVRPGAKARDVDAVAREHLHGAGFGDYFSHSLGHGIGLEVHEAPRVSAHSEHVLQENTVVTIEPGVYLPERFGVRIEDLVVARADGPENLTRTPKTLLVL
jgi:Xaa-Pro aminopeptidase